MDYDSLHLSRLPAAKTAVDDAGTATFFAGWIGSAVANLARYADGNTGCVIGIDGRGSLKITEAEFDQLLSSMLCLAHVRAGGIPTEK